MIRLFSGQFMRRTTSMYTERLKIAKILVVPKGNFKKWTFLPRDLPFSKLQMWNLGICSFEEKYITMMGAFVLTLNWEPAAFCISDVEIVNRHSSWEIFDGVGKLTRKDSNVDLFMSQWKYFSNLFPSISLTRNFSPPCIIKGEATKH